MPRRTEAEQSITLRVTPEQRRRIERAAQREDRTLSSFLRVAAMDRVDQILGTPVGQCITASPAQARVV
jgi:uncharacterized protein (DUF1778 family)